MAVICGTHGFQVEHPVTVTGSHGFQVTHGMLTGTHGFQVTHPATLTGSHGPKVTHQQQQSYDVFGPGGAGTGGSSSGGPGVAAILNETTGFRIRMHDATGAGTIDVTDDVISFDLDEQRGMPSTATIVLADPPVDEDGNRLAQYRPELDPSDTFYQRLDGSNIDGSYGVRRYWTIEMAAAGEVGYSPHLIQIDYDWSYNNGFPIATLSLMDYSARLLLKDQSMDDFELTTAHTVIAAILSNFGVGSFRLEFPDYDVLQFSPKGGTPLDWIKQLLWVRQAEWFWERDTFVATVRSYNRSGSAMWTLEDFLDIESFSYKRSVQGLANEFVVRKVEKGSGLLADAQCRGGSCLGFNDVQLSAPAVSVYPKIINVVHGLLKNFVYYDAAGDPLQLLPNPVYGGPPASSVRFTYEPIVGAIGTSTAWPPGVEPEYHIQFMGRTAAQAAEPAGFDKAYMVRIKNQTSQSRYGVRRDSAPIESILVPNKEAAEYLARALLEENIRLTNFANASGLLHPFLRPAQTVEIVMTLAGFDAGSNFYVERVTKRGDAQGGTMSIEVTRFAA